MGLLVVTGEEEGGASSDFRLLAGLLANLGGRRVETMEKFLLLKHLKLLVVKWMELVVVGCQLEGQTIIFSGQPARQL